jgi:pimeloyl-ACP methyl ester carboxylesterase
VNTQHLFKFLSNFLFNLLILPSDKQSQRNDNRESIHIGENYVKLKISTLIIWGCEDRITPVALGDRFHREIIGSTLVIIEKCEHSANEEQPDQFTTALLNFLKAGKE